MASTQIFRLLRASLDRIPVIDTHEVLGRTQDFACPGFVELLYRLWTAEAARFLWGRRGSKNPPESTDQWAEVRVFLRSIENTLQFRYLLRMLADLFDYHAVEVNEKTWAFLSEKIRNYTSDAHWPYQVLHDKANIESIFYSSTSLAPSLPSWARNMALPVFNVDHFLFAATPQGRRNIERRYNAALSNLGQLLYLIDVVIRRVAEQGFVGLKTRLATFRTLHVEDMAPTSVVEGIFNKPGRSLTPADQKTFQDFILHILVRFSILHNLPLQIDTGLDAAGLRSLNRANPLHLTDLIFNYADARFVILHGGFPYTGETAVMAKTFPNIFLDGSWLWHAATATAKATLHEWLEVVPCGKITMWGGNSRYPEASYASLLITRDVVAEVLAEKVGAGYFNESVAVDIAWKIFRENARSFYRVDLKRERLSQLARPAK